MKLLVFAHTPPPHHGQSYMVELMLKHFGGDRRKKPRDNSAPGAELGIECYHVNARLSKRLEDIGDFRVGKFLLLIWYCLQAIVCRFRYGVENFYYIPAPGKRSALYRDWLVLFLCRPFFRRLILHWHASGLGKWLETSAPVRRRALTYRAAGNADLSIALSNYGRADAEKLYPKRLAIVGNGIPDPCPTFTAEVLPRRRARLKARRQLLAGAPVPAAVASLAGPDANLFKVLFLGHCTREKGLFEALEGTLLAQRRLRAQNSSLGLRLIVAGSFLSKAEELEFRDLCRDAEGGIEYAGFIEGESKKACLANVDAFCFPSHIESFGLVLAEAMAFGLPIVTARCGAVPEVVTPQYPGLVGIRRPDQVADALRAAVLEDSFVPLRTRFERHYTVQSYVSRLAEALECIRESPEGPLSQPILILPQAGTVAAQAHAAGTVAR